MPYDVDIGDGADALGQNQLSDALAGTYWVSGWDATLGTGDLEVDIAAGDGAVDGTDVSTASTQTIDFTGDPDGTDPRKAVIYVDSGGTVQKNLGTPQPVDPSGEIRFRTYNPSPPASVSGVVVAEVWLAAGETVLESADIRDRRVSNDAIETLSFDASIIVNGYVDESASRSLNTTYTNNTGNPLEIKVFTRLNSDSDEFGTKITVDGVDIDEQRLVDANSEPVYDINTAHTVSATVPNGSTYSVVDSRGPQTILEWKEQEWTIQ